MPRNLMPVRRDGPAVLDFQDAVRGPIAYDALSLLKDCFLELAGGARRRLARALPPARAAAGLPVRALARFLRDAD